MNSKIEILEPLEFDIIKILRGEEPLTFLAGAGISVDPPSNLVSARQMMKAIINFGVPENATEKILSLKGLRYEFLVQAFRDRYDNDLRLMEYFSEVTEPNINHFYLAHMIKEHYVVITTNFDFLIERAVGLDDPALKIIITKEDFEKFGNPEENEEKGVLTLYKIHGCLMNPITGENTRETIVTTLDVLGKVKEGTLFSVEPHKRSFLQVATKNRTLVILGYSGGDDFDILPTLYQMQELKRVIWISHSSEARSQYNTFRIKSEVKLNEDALKELPREDQVLYKLNKISKNIDIIKIKAHTSSLLAQFIEPIVFDENLPILDPNEWLIKHIREPKKGEKEYFAGRILLEHGYHNDAYEYLQQSYNISKQNKELHIMANTAGNLGLTIFNKGDFQTALKYHQEACKLHEKLKINESMVRDLNNIGIVYRNLENNHKALKFFNKSLKVAQLDSNWQGMGRAAGNIGIMLMEMYELEEAISRFKEALNYFEKCGDLVGMAVDYGNLGITYKKLNDWSRSYDCYEKAYRIHEQVGNLEGMATVLSNIGNLFVEQENIEEALRNHQRAYDLDVALCNEDRIELDKKNIGTIFSIILGLLMVELRKLVNRFYPLESLHLTQVPRESRLEYRIEIQVQKMFKLIQSSSIIVNELEKLLKSFISRLDAYLQRFTEIETNLKPEKWTTPLPRGPPRSPFKSDALIAPSSTLKPSSPFNYHGPLSLQRGILHPSTSELKIIMQKLRNLYELLTKFEISDLRTQPLFLHEFLTDKIIDIKAISPIIQYKITNFKATHPDIQKLRDNIKDFQSVLPTARDFRDFLKELK